MKKVEMNQEYTVEVGHGRNSGIKNVTAEVSPSLDGNNVKFNIEVKGEIPDTGSNLKPESADITITASGNVV